MRIRSNPFLIVTIALVFSVFYCSSALCLQVNVRLFGNHVDGMEATSGLMIYADLFDSGGNLKATGLEMVQISGEWDIDFEASSARILPGDRLKVRHDGSDYNLTIPAIRLTSVNPGTDVIRGKITPRRDEVLAHWEGSTLELTGWEDYDYNSDPVAVSPDGRFTIDLKPRDLRRGDDLYVGFIQDPFTLFVHQYVPKLLIDKSSNLAILFGPEGRSYKALLFNRSGLLKGRSLVNIMPYFYEPVGIVQFIKRSGRPIPIRTGHRLVMKGPQGFGMRVPPLAVTVDPDSDTVSVQTIPDTVVELEVWLYNDDGKWLEGFYGYLTSGPDGQCTFDYSASKDLRPGDYFQASICDARGNVIETRVQALPSD